jgi:probable F420-dependent oxidoreductase
MKIGIVLSLPSDAENTRRYSEIRALALQAESAGFDSLWVFDHLFARFPPKSLTGSWESWTLMTALAEATERVELGSLVLSVPFRNPVLLAKMATTLDEVSGGRLILGLGSGWHEPEFDAMGIPFNARVDRFEEALQIIVPLLREGRVTFKGRHFQAADAELLPRGPRPAGPPILIASSGPRMLRLTARWADMWNTAWYGHAGGELRDAEAAMRQACLDVGRDPATLVTTAGVAVASGEEAAVSKEDVLTGTPEEMAQGLQGFADAGVAHVICRLSPMTSESLDHLSQALALFRQSSPTRSQP